MALGARVKQIREERNLTQQQLADAIGWSQQALATLERRDSAKSKYAGQIAKVLGVDLGWLLVGNEILGAKTDNHSEQNDLEIVGSFETWDDDTPIGADEVALPYYDEVSLDCGNGRINTEYQDTGKTLRFSRHTLDKIGVMPKDVILAKANGDSNEPLITDGATIAYDISKAFSPIKENRFYAIEVGGALKIKMLHITHDKKVEVISANPAYKPIVIPLDEFYETHRILGWVFWWATLARW
nr:S24 family peptidase [uncultured Moraxella sp.]